MRKINTQYASNIDESYIDLVEAISSHNQGADKIYADSVHKRRKEHLEEEYGKIKEGSCFCRLFRRRCPQLCEFISMGEKGNWRDHGKIYHKDGKYTYIGEPYDLNQGDIENLIEISKKYNLDVHINAHISAHYPGDTCAVIIQPKD